MFRWERLGILYCWPQRPWEKGNRKNTVNTWVTNDLCCSSGFSEHEKFSLFQAKQCKAGTNPLVNTLHGPPLPVSLLASITESAPFLQSQTHNKSSPGTWGCVPWRPREGVWHARVLACSPRSHRLRGFRWKKPNLQPLFCIEVAAGVWGQREPLSSFASPAPEKVAIVPEGPPQGCSCARSLLSPAAGLGRGFVFCWQQQIWPIGISHAAALGWHFQVGHLRGGTGGAGRFGHRAIPLQGPLLLVKPRHLVTFTGVRGPVSLQSWGGFSHRERGPAEEGWRQMRILPQVTFPGGKGQQPCGKARAPQHV